MVKYGVESVRWHQLILNCWARIMFILKARPFLLLLGVFAATASALQEEDDLNTKREGKGGIWTLFA